MSSSMLIGLGAVVWMCAYAVGQEAAPATRPGGAEDSRFTDVHHLDRPWGFEAQFADKGAWEKRAEFLRRQARVALGVWPEPEKTPLNAVIHGKIERDAYTVEKVYFASLPGYYVTGNLYRPKGKSGKVPDRQAQGRPAVLAPYGHWPNGRFQWRDEAGVKKEIDSGAEVDPVAAKSPLQASCVMLARMGCVVFHYDMVGYGDSKKFEHPLGFTDVEAALRLQSIMGLQTWNSVRALDFVLSLPEVDAGRVGVTGSSSGGTQTIALDAVDGRTGVAFPKVMISMNMQGGCVCENAPLYRVMTNNVELACLMAPKPQGAAAAKDWTHDFEQRGLPEMKRVYGLLGAAGDVEGKFFPFGHNHNLHSREMMYAFMNKHLRLGWPEEVVKEKPFEPIDPKQLSVWDEGHPLPADATDAAGVRAYWTKASDAQLGKLAKENSEEYAKVIKGALSAMVVDEMPGSTEVEVLGAAFEPKGKWEGFLSRKGAGERVPCAVTVPGAWDGTVVVSSGAVEAGGNARAAKVVVTPFMAEGFKPTTRPTEKLNWQKRANADYAGYTAGYERTVLGNRVHDLLTAIAFARSWEGTKAVRVAGKGEAGVAGLLACVLAGEAVAGAEVDVAGVDFGDAESPAEAMFLPGGLKYGGVKAFAGLVKR